MLSKEVITELQRLGGNRWQKAGHDRIYFSGEALRITEPLVEQDFEGVDFEMANFWANRDHISKRVLGHLKPAAAYIDVMSGAVHLARINATTPAWREEILGAIEHRTRYFLAAVEKKVAETEKAEAEVEKKVAEAEAEAMAAAEKAERREEIRRKIRKVTADFYAKKAKAEALEAAAEAKNA